MTDYYYAPTAPRLIEGPYKDVTMNITEGDYHYLKPEADANDVPQVWAVRAAYMIVYASAIAANRNLRILQRGPTGNSLQYWKTDSITAGQTISGQLGRLVFMDGIAQCRDQFYFGMSEKMIIAGDESLLFFVNNAQSGDAAYIYLLLEYMNRKLGMPTPYSKGGYD